MVRFSGIQEHGNNHFWKEGTENVALYSLLQSQILFLHAFSCCSFKILFFCLVSFWALLYILITLTQICVYVCVCVSNRPTHGKAFLEQKSGRVQYQENSPCWEDKVVCCIEKLFYKLNPDKIFFRYHTSMSTGQEQLNSVAWIFLLPMNALICHQSNWFCLIKPLNNQSSFELCHVFCLKENVINYNAVVTYMMSEFVTSDPELIFSYESKANIV